MLKNLFINLYFKKIKHKQISSPFRIASSNPTIPKNHRYKAEDKIWNSRSKFEIPFEEKRKIMGPVYRNSIQQLIHGGGIAHNQIYANASLSSSSPPSPRPTFIHLPRWKLCEAGSAGRRDNGGSPLRWRLKEILPKRRKKKKKIGGDGTWQTTRIERRGSELSFNDRFYFERWITVSSFEINNVARRVWSIPRISIIIDHVYLESRYHWFFSFSFFSFTIRKNRGNGFLISFIAAIQ